MKKTLEITGEIARNAIIKHVQNAPEGQIVTISEPTRSPDQNAAQWPILDAFAKQAEIPINGEKTKISADEWKNILTAVFRGESGRVAHWEGKMILIGARTSKFTKKQFSEWIEFLHATAVDRGVVVYQDEAG